MEEIQEENVEVQIPLNYHLTSTLFQCEYQVNTLLIPVNPYTYYGDNFIYGIELNAKKIKLKLLCLLCFRWFFQRGGFNLFFTLIYSKEHVDVMTIYPLQIGNREPLLLEFKIKERIYYQLMIKD